MAELRKCSRCKSSITLDYYSVNRQGEYCKCSDKCRVKGADYNREYNKLTTTCNVCGKTGTPSHLARHKKSHLCKQDQNSIEPN